MSLVTIPNILPWVELKMEIIFLLCSQLFMVEYDLKRLGTILNKFVKVIKVLENYVLS